MAPRRELWKQALDDNNKYRTLRHELENLADRLERRAGENEHQYKHGSPVSSMSEDMAAGDVAREQRSIARDIRALLRAH
jgi:hypothetical protein